MEKIHSFLQDEIDKLIDLVVYFQILGSFAPNADFRQIIEMVTSTHDFIKNSYIWGLEPEYSGLII
jgi:hypothetical protein